LGKSIQRNVEPPPKFVNRELNSQFGMKDQNSIPAPPSMDDPPD
jgi:hypothetical protein